MNAMKQATVEGINEAIEKLRGAILGDPRWQAGTGMTKDDDARKGDAMKGNGMKDAADRFVVASAAAGNSRRKNPRRLAARAVVPLLAVMLLAMTAGRAQSADSVDRVMLLPSGSVSGKVTATSPGGIDLEGRDGQTKKVPIEKIRELQFGGEPQDLKAARTLLIRGRPADALEDLKKLTPADFEGVDPLVIQEKEYVEAAASARAALRGTGDVKAAGGLVSGFLTKNSKSYHTLELQELLGDLLAKAGLPEKAAAAYDKVALGPPAFKVRAASAKARMLFDQKKFDEAAKAFDEAIAVDANDEASKAQKCAAGLGKAKCLAQAGKAAEAVSLVLVSIRQASPEEKEMLAEAYNTLGAAHRAGGKEQDALIAFLTVDLVYNSVPEAHAEALANLVELWQKANNPERSRQAMQSLETSYPESPWVKLAKATVGKT